MKKKIMLGCVVTTIIIVSASLTSVIGGQTVNSSNNKYSPLFKIRTQRFLNKQNNEVVTSEYIGKGKTIIGELHGCKTDRINHIVDVFNKVGIDTIVSENIINDIWFKGVINSSINPLTTIFQCKNGYLLKNPILEEIVEKICRESTNIAKINGINISYNQTIQKTKEVIKNTSENYSSMLQSFKKSKKTEINSINGKLVEIGKKHDSILLMNEILTHSIYFLYDNE